MFDPSKLELDLDENLDNKSKQTPKSSENDKITESKDSTPKEKTIPESKENSDFLSDLLENDTKNSLLGDTNDLLGNSDNEDAIKIIAVEKSDENTQKTNIPEDDTKNYGIENDTQYDKELIQKEKLNEIKKTQETEKIIYNTNSKNIQDIFTTLIEKEYDFVTLEPFNEFIKIIYRKDKVEKETQFIKYPTYTQILIKTKTITNLKVDESEINQEGTGEIVLKAKGYKVLSKTSPGGYGEKIFLKLQEIQKKVKQEKKSISFIQILGFLGAALFTTLLIGGGFLTFVLLNASTVSELTFFNNLGVDVGSIRDFTSKLVNGLFSVIILIETLFLFTFTFKAILTKKEFKKDKITRIIFSVFFLIITFLSGFLWITLSQKINELKGQNYGKMLTYDNAKYLSPIFDKNGSLVNINESLIGPVTLRFNISEILNQLVNDNNYKPQKITWIFGDEEIEKPVNDLEIIYTFDTPGLHEVNLKIDVLNAIGEPEVIKRTVAKLNIDNIIQITEEKVSGGGVIYKLDASEIKKLGKIEWYRIPDLKNLSDSDQSKAISLALKKPAIQGYLYESKILYDQEIILGIKIISDGIQKEGLEKIFILSGNNNNDEIKADIFSEADLNNTFKYTFKAENIETIIGNGNVKSFLWRIGDKTIKKDANLSNLENSSQIEYTFKNYGNFNIYLDIIDSRGNIQTIEKIITIEKKLQLSRGIRIQNDNNRIENLKYNAKLHEYVIDEIGVPTIISLDARFIKSIDNNYVLRNVEWDFGADGDIDSTDKKTQYEISYEGRHQITGIFYFEHRRKPEDKIIVRENIYIEGVKKEAQINFDIKVNRPYVPVIVSFDASKSQVKNENIVKFTWDYGDGKSEVRDALVPGHKYSLPGDYEIKLVVTTKSGKEYSKTKKLILKPKPQSIKITSSLKSAPTYQSIDFLSDKSEGQITSYFWNFGDGGTSTKANPSYQYKKPGTYVVKLRLDFANNNVLTDEVEMKIFEE